MSIVGCKNGRSAPICSSFVRPTAIVALLCLLFVTACGSSDQEAKVEAERLEAQRIAIERARQEREAQAQRQRLARTFARKAGRQIMNAIGGGRDLIVDHQLKYFDPSTGTLEIAMDVSFNGSVIRSNNYRVTGVLTVREDGREPEFARRSANKMYTDAEKRATALGVTLAGAMILADMNKESGDKGTADQQMSTGTWQIDELELCNRAGAETIFVAYAFREGANVYTRGWFAIGGDKCEVLTAVDEEKEVRLFAMSESRSWTGGTPYCVNMREPFKIRQSGTSCEPDATAKDFFSMKLTELGNGRMTVILDEKLDSQLERLVAESRGQQ